MNDDALAALPIGRTVTVSKTVSESDVYLFAGITGDFSPNHTDEAYMRKTRYGRRIAVSVRPASSICGSRRSPAPSASRVK